MPEGTGVPGCEQTNECFVPADTSVDVGGSVTWTNDDSVLHTVWAGNIKEDAKMVGYDYPNGFQSGLVNPGDAYTVEDLMEGTYPYYCSVHPWMTGMLFVTAAHGDDDTAGSMTTGGSTTGDEDMMDDEMRMEAKDDEIKMEAKDDKMKMTGERDEMKMEAKDDKMKMTGEDSMKMDGMKDDSMMMESKVPESIDDVTVMIETQGGDMGSPLQIDIAFTDADGNSLSHVNYRLTAMQGDETVIDEGAGDPPAHSHMGSETHQTPPLAVAASETPVDVSVYLYGFGMQEVTGPSGDVASYRVVPEFGAVAMAVLAAAIVSIIAITAKTRLAPRI